MCMPPLETSTDSPGATPAVPQDPCQHWRGILRLNDPIRWYGTMVQNHQRLSQPFNSDAHLMFCYVLPVSTHSVS